MIHISLCCDDNYAPYSATVIASVMEHNKDVEITFHILHTNITESRQQTLKEWIEMKHNHICFYKVEISMFKQFPLGCSYLYYGAYFRLYLAECLKFLDKVIYLDCDLVVNASIQELWETDMDEYDVAGVRDRINDYIRVYNRLRYPMQYGYINSGMMVINLKRWRDMHFFERAVEISKKYPDALKNHDQDLINMICHGKIKFIDFKYNLLEYYLYTEDWLYLDCKYYPQIIEACKNPVIIHFCMPTKPWHKECVNPFKELYYKYRRMTPWPEVNLVHKKYHLSSKQKFKLALEKLGLYKVERKSTLRTNLGVIEESDNVLF